MRRADSGAGPGPVAVLSMAEWIRRHDWSATPLGAREAWPQSLRTTLDIMLGSGHAMCLAWGPDRTFLYNDAYAPFLGARHPAALGMGFAAVWPEIWGEIGPLVDRVYAGETTTFHAMPLVMTRNGFAEDTWWDFSYSPVRDEGGAVAGLLNVAADATPRVLAERERDRATEKLRVSEAVAHENIQRVELALEAGAIIGTWFWDIVADRFTIDEPFARAFGLDPALGREGIPLAQIVATVHPDDQAGLADAINEAVLRGGAYAHQYRVRRTDGNYYWLEANGRVDHAPDGTPTMFPGVLIDIEGRRAVESERDRMVEALAASEARFRALFENIDAGFCISEVKFDDAGHPIDHRVIEANPAFERHTGLSNAVGRYASEVAPGIEQHWHDAYGHVAKTGEAIRFEGEAKPLGRWYDAHLFPVGGGRVAMLIADTTTRREAEGALARSEAKWRTVFETLHEGFILGEVIRDASGHVADWRYEAVNDAWHDLIDVPRGTAVGRTIREVFPGIEAAWVDEFAHVVEMGEPLRFTRRVGMLDRWYDGVAQPIGGDRFTVIFIEVTERIRRERRQATLLTLADELRGRSDLQTIVTAAARCLADGLEVDRVGSGIVNLREDTIDVRSDWCEPGVSSVVGQHAFASYGSYIDDLRCDDIVAVDDVAADPRTTGRQAGFDAIQTRSFLDLPISFDGRLYAVVFAHSRTLHAWTDGERQFVEQVGDRVRVALARQRMEDAQRVLTQEMAHRMKNTLAMVQAIATQTLRQARTMDEGREAITSRLAALARAQDIMTRTNFAEADVREVADAAIAPHRLAGERITLAGPPVELSAQRALGLSLAIHELATNAAKYGALSNETGRVDMVWNAAGGAFVFRWIESGGPAVTPPTRRGFGSKLIERIVASYFDGEGRIDFDPAGIRFTLTGAVDRPSTQPNP
ncbi:PAS domain-containing protein [Aureimonas flava]|uniref:Blue-light-activated histidine kinase n=2 Tax=Aureimonas flava TaxID=2320271 RepID=A0A3A1WQX2_9HYPH|nr:PAS domain-containing protein [Aureimonas flava]